MWNGLSQLSVVATGLLVFTLMVVGSVAGRATRLWRPARPGATTEESTPSVDQEGYLLGAVLGLLGLLLAFSFGMVLNRYEVRRALAIQEANAIGTAYLRSQLLDEPHRSRLSSLLVDYTGNRIALSSRKAGRSDYLARNDRLLLEIWSAVVAARESALTHGLTTTLLSTFNEVIDLDTERKVAWEQRLPAEVLVLLLAYLFITAGIVGYQIDGPRGRRAALAMFVLVALSLGFMTDINRPIGNEPEIDKPLVMLLKSLKEQPPRAFDQFAPAELRAAP